MTASRAALWAFTALCAAAIYGPILYTVAGAFLPMKAGIIQNLSPTLDSFAALVRDKPLLRSFLITVAVGTVAASVAVVFGVAAALFLRSARSTTVAVVQALIFLPFVMPPIMTGLALLTFFSSTGIKRSLATVAAGHVVLILAVAFRLVAVRLASLGPSMIEAALDLGASHAQVFRRILLPNLAGTLGAAFILCFALSFDETLVTILLTGTDSTFPIRLWGMTRLGISPAANAIMALLLLASFTLSGPLLRLLGTQR